jgi:hypothetical protein
MVSEGITVSRAGSKSPDFISGGIRVNFEVCMADL